MSQRYAATVAGWLVFLASSLFYLFHTGQHSFWLDSAEFVAVAHNAGVAHPPGTPLYVILSGLFTLIPVGAAAFRVHLFNALLGGLHALLLFKVGLEVARATGDENEGPGLPGIICAAAVAAVFTLSPAVWFQSVRAEVYTLNGVIMLGIVLCAIRWAAAPDRVSYALVASLLVGLGLGNHHFLTVLGTLACVAYLTFFPAVRARLMSKLLIPMALLALAGLLVYVYLPVRAADGWLMWGDPSTPSGFYSLLSAEAFHISVTEMPKAPFMVAMLTIFEKWVDLAGFPLFVAGSVGLIFAFIANPKMGGLLLLLIIAGGTSKAIMYLDVENPDDHAYFLMGLQGLAVAAVALVHFPHIIGWAGRKAATTAWVTAAVLVLLTAWSGSVLYRQNVSHADLSAFSGGDVLNRHFHERLPPDALFMPSYYATFFNHLYFREVEQRRPDVAMVHQSLYSRFEGGKGYALDMAADWPETEPLFAEYFETGGFPLAALLKIAETREVVLETDVLEVDPALAEFAPFSLGTGGMPLPMSILTFRGPGVQLNLSAESPAVEMAHQKQFWTAFYQDMEGTPLHPELSKLLVWYHYRNALYFINEENYEAALLETQLARNLTPNSGRLVDLETRLRSQ